MPRDVRDGLRSARMDTIVHLHRVVDDAKIYEEAREKRFERHKEVHRWDLEVIEG